MLDRGALVKLNRKGCEEGGTEDQEEEEGMEGGRNRLNGGREERTKKGEE